MGSKIEELRSHTEELEAELRAIEEDDRALSDKVEDIEAKLEAELAQKEGKIRGAFPKTYLTLWFNSQGRNPTFVVARLQEIGFKPTRGEYDFVYSWGRQTDLQDLFQLGDTVHKTLKGSKVLYRLETF